MSDTKLMDGNTNKRLIEFLHELTNRLVGDDVPQISQIVKEHGSNENVVPCVCIDFKEMQLKVSNLDYLNWMSSSEDDNVLAALSDYNLIKLKVKNSGIKTITPVVLAFFNIDHIRGIHGGDNVIDLLEDEWQESHAMLMSFFNHQTNQFVCMS